jgi:AMMECR1 domain-containing protein/aromatic ring-opening dioxygenase LigB subunit
LCHAPIVVPEVAGARSEACAKSTAAMRAAAARIYANRPDVVVVLSPHTPRPRGAFSLVATERVRGDFAAFGAPQVVVDLPGSSAARALIAAHAQKRGVDVEPLMRTGRLDQGLDHGALVPLTFLVEAGWCGPTVVVGLPADGTRDDNHAFGRALADAARAAEQRWAVVASGDCSHRLLPGAPAGFHPLAQRFDDELARAVGAGDDRAVSAIDVELRDLAAEDVVDTVEIAAAATEFEARGREVFSYEGPFGVGYLVAMLHDPMLHDPMLHDAKLHDTRSREGTRPRDNGQVLVDVARDALTAWHEGRARSTFDTRAADAETPAGVFVTWRSVSQSPDADDENNLRGCVGRMRIDGRVSDAVAELAVSAASSDPRFPPIGAHERVSAEVTLLSPSQPVTSLAELNPAAWGVEVRCGHRHGVLLPAIDGVDDVETQVAIVLRKAGIAPHENYELRKFRARKVSQASSQVGEA